MCNTDHDYTAHLQRPGGKYKNVSTHYYTPETSDASSTTCYNDESVHLPDPPQLGKELLNENDSSDSNLSATREAKHLMERCWMCMPSLPVCTCTWRKATASVREASTMVQVYEHAQVQQIGREGDTLVDSAPLQFGDLASLE